MDDQESNIRSIDYYRKLKAKPKLTEQQKIAKALKDYGSLRGNKDVVCEQCGTKQRKDTKRFFCIKCNHKNELPDDK
jgi:anaerobic ribonucleoside-triphosphate reductase